MPKRTTTEITVEMDELVVIRSRDRFTCGHCELCSAMVQTVTFAQAASISGVSDLEIARQIKRRILHPTEARDGRVLICLNSLLK